VARPAWLEGREVIAVFEDRADPKPSYMMWLECAAAGSASSATTAMSAMSSADAELALAPDVEPAGDGAAF